MTDAQKVKEWAAYYKVSPALYQMNALLACLKNDGEKVLSGVLQELGLAKSVDLVKDAMKRDI